MGRPESLQNLCLLFVAGHFQQLKAENIARLPYPILKLLYSKITPLDLHRLELALNTPPESNQDIWLYHYSRTFSTRYRSWFKVSLPNEVSFCAVSKLDGDYRRQFLEDHFHVLIEDANRIATLLQRGVLEVNLANIVADFVKREEKACCHVKMEQIKADMMLCAPFVKSLKVSRSKSLLSPLLKDVLKVLVKTVRCLRLVFLHDYRALKETVQYFMQHGNIVDFHTNWQPQRCSLPAKCAVEIFSLLAGLQIGPVESVDKDAVSSDQQTTWKPYDLYDIAVTGSQYDAQNPSETFECAAVQCDKSINHISMSSFLLTQNGSVHHFIAHTLLNRWLTLESLKLTCLNHLDIDIFKGAVISLVEHHNLRQICFEDTQFTNPMDLFMSLLRVLIRNKDILLKKLTMLGIGHPFIGDFTTELIKAREFHAITCLDLSFSSLNNTRAVPTFCEYIKRDKALRTLNLNCCKLPPGEPTAALLRSVGESCVAELILDFNHLNTTLLEDSLVYMIESDKNLELLSLTLCTFQRAFLKTLFEAITTLPRLQKIYLAENRIGDIPELVDLLIKLLTTRPHLDFVDLSSNFLSGKFLLNMATSLESLGRRNLFYGLNLSYNMDRGEVMNSKELVRQRYGRLCQHLICMILYEDAGEANRQEYAAQM